MITLRNIYVDYQNSSREKTAAVAGASAEFPEGKISAMLGPSGCGKTSLIHVMAGLLEPSRGEILVKGNPLGGIRKSTAIIFQDFGLLPWKTVYANAELPLKISGMKKHNRKDIILPLLEEFGLGTFLKYYPKQLSGGMKQRLAIARSLAAGPDLLLMDEPFSSLDALTREDAQDFLLETASKRKLSIIMVTHSIEEAVYLADRVYMMSGKNPGTIKQYFDIPERSKPWFRADPRFQELCITIRGALKNADAPEGNQP